MASPHAASASLTPSASTSSLAGAATAYPPAGPAAPAAAASATPIPPSSATKPGKKATGATTNKTKPTTNPLPARADEVTYRTKYQQLKGKVKDIEDENADILAKIMKTKRQIQRLRLERSILYEHLVESKGKGPAADIAPSQPPEDPDTTMQVQAQQENASSAEVPSHSTEPQISVSSPPKPSEEDDTASLPTTSFTIAEFQAAHQAALGAGGRGVAAADAGTAQAPESNAGAAQTGHAAGGDMGMLVDP